MEKNKKINCIDADYIFCPYCGYKNSNEDVTDTYYEDFECSECGETFVLSIEYRAYYSTSKKKCKKEHNYKFDELYLNQSEYVGYKTGLERSCFIDVPKEKWELRFVYKCTECDKKKIESTGISETPCVNCYKGVCDKYICKEYRAFEKKKVEELRAK